MRVVGGALTVDESQIARTAAEIRASAAAVTNASTLSGTTSAPQTEVDGHLEVAREKLWQMAWAAVRSCVCIDRIGSELPLHTCQQLQDLYLGGMDGEFRYSQNVKSLLDLVLCLARPRLGISITEPQSSSGKSFSLDGVAVEDGRTAQATTKMNKIADAQFHRGIMNLLRSVVAVDIVSFSALVATLSKLAFGRSFMEMSYYLWPSARSTNIDLSRRCIVLGPVDPKLRSDAGEYLHTILIAKEIAKIAGSQGPNPSSDSTATSTSTPLPQVFLDLPQEWNAVALEVIVQHFVAELCANPSIARSNLVDLSQSKGDVISSSGDNSKPGLPSSPSKQQPAAGGFSGFFSAIGRMITSSLESDDDEVVGSEDGSDAGEPRVSEGSGAVSGSSRWEIFDDIFSHRSSHLKSTRIDFTVHSIQSLRESISLSILSNISPAVSLVWCPFIASVIDLKVLQAALRNGIKASFSLQRHPSLSAKQMSVWSQILTSLLCILSAWRPKELYPLQINSSATLSNAPIPAVASAVQSDAPYLLASAAEAKAYSDLIIGAVDTVKSFLLSSR
jgi:hypothetical protein